MSYDAEWQCEHRGCDAQSSAVVIEISTGRERMLCWAHAEAAEAGGKWMFENPDDPNPPAATREGTDDG